VRFHSSALGRDHDGKNLGAIIGDLNDLLYDRDKIVDEFGNPKEIITSAPTEVRVEKKGAPTPTHDRRARSHSRQLRPAPRHRCVVLRSEGVHALQSLDGMAEGGSLGGNRTKRRAGVERLPLWARKQILDKKIRVFTLRASRSRARRPTAATCSCACRATRSRRVLRRVADAERLPHHARTVPRRGAQAVRQEVRQARRRGRELQHGGHDQGLRARARNQGR